MNIRMIAAFTALSAILLAPLLASAQLSDRELKALYCFGYFRKQSDARRSICQNPSAPPQLCKAADDKLKRVLSYLMAKSAFNASSGHGPSIAMAQGALAGVGSGRRML